MTATKSTIAETLSPHERTEFYSAGRLLFREGETPRGVYIVHSGDIDLVFSRRNGVTKPLRVAKEGELLGVSCILSRRCHDCSATTRTPCELGFVDRDTFLREVDHSPSVWFSVLQVLSQDVNSCYDCMRLIHDEIAAEKERGRGEKKISVV